MGKPLQINKQVEASIRRLKSMGLKVSIIPMSDDWVILAIDYKSILDYIKRRVSQAISYPKHIVLIDDTLKILEIHLWRGNLPKPLMDKVFKQ